MHLYNHNACTMVIGHYMNSFRSLIFRVHISLFWRKRKVRMCDMTTMSLYCVFQIYMSEWERHRTKLSMHEVDLTCSCRMPYSFNSCWWRCTMTLRKLTASLKFEVFLQTLYRIFCCTREQGKFFHQLNITKRSKAQKKTTTAPKAQMLTAIRPHTSKCMHDYTSNFF
jgi:hypothetical protein